MANGFNIGQQQLFPNFNLGVGGGQGANPALDFSSVLGPFATSSLFGAGTPGLQSPFLSQGFLGLGADASGQQGIPGEIKLGGGGDIGVGIRGEAPGGLLDAAGGGLGAFGDFIKSPPSLAGSLAGAAAIGNTINELSGFGQGDRGENIEAVTTTLGGLGGAVLGGPIGAFVGSVGGDIAGDVFGSIFGGSTNPRKEQRDKIRGIFEQALGEGSRFPGVGGSVLQILHTNNEAQIPENILSEAIALADPIAEALAHRIPGGTSTPEVRQDIGALIANAIGTGSKGEKDTVNNLLSLVNKLGLKAEDIRAGIAQSVKEGHVDSSRLGVYSLNMSKLTGLSAEEEMDRIEAMINGERR